MPFRPQHSLLRVDESKLNTIDTTSVENLFGMWSLFSKTSDAMENGKRLENLSWRLWNRETFCCARGSSQAPSTLSPKLTFTEAPQAATTDIPMPELSSSPGSSSSSSDELDDDLPATTIPKARPELRCSSYDSCDSCRPREKHITPDDLESLVKSIKQNEMLTSIELPTPTPSSRVADPPSITTSQDLSNFKLSTAPTTSTAAPSQTTTPRASSVTTSQPTLLESSTSTVDTNDDKASQTVGSESSSNTEMSTHSIIRGFVPGGAPSSYRSQTNLTAQPTPILKTSPQYQQAKPKKKGPMFTIGTSSGEDESSFESHMYRSSLSESLKRNSTASSISSRKQTSFKDEVAVARAAEHSPVFESDDEDEEVSESAIEDDDDSSDWEDSDDQSGPSSINEKDMFQRVDSRPNLTSRRSLLTSLIHEPDRAKALANAASRSSPAIRRTDRGTPNGPSAATSPQPEAQFETAQAESSRSKPTIMTTSNTHPTQLSLSPRTTRRNMLSTELTESLRKNLLWERQHRSTGNLAALKRRHTSMDAKQLPKQRSDPHPDPKELKQNPEPAPLLSHQDGTKRFTNDYFHAGLQEYHAKGW